MLALSAATARAACKAQTLKFIMMEGETQQAAIEDDIRADLAVIGIDVVAEKFSSQDDFNAARVAGNFDMVFSATWGAPYDPHSYVNSWTAADEEHYAALPTAGIDTTQFTADVNAILGELDAAQRQAKWTALLTSIHNEVIHLPLYGFRDVSITTRSRLSGYAPGTQNFDYPLHKALVVSGSKTVKVAPRAQGGLFSSAGGLEPHATRPNEFFSNNWLYEGLVRYGSGGAVEPALATGWTSTANSDGSETVRFTLRTGVKFHDGADFDCAAVKLNFDHVFGNADLIGWYGWYDLPNVLKEWSCNGETFVLSTSQAYYPLMQELAYIRPIVMLSPTAFVGSADPVAENSCPTIYNTKLTNPSITCVGVSSFSGTGPFKFKSRTPTAGATADSWGITPDDLVVFEKNADYWGGAPDIEELHVVKYDSAADVYDALIAGNIDAVLGSGVLEPARVKELQYDDSFELHVGEETSNHAIVLNIADKEVRKAVVHAVNKNHIIETQLSGFESPTSQLFSKSVPYCDIELTPKFDYDLEKAELLNCPAGASSKKKSDSGLSGGMVALIVILAVAVAGLVAGVAFIVMKEKAGEPLFMDVTTKTPLQEKVAPYP